ncbi:MAG TPA: tetratricopeptide repeat protein [Puia sp.]|nr:tetratricopeptide repeat protein [Puia sp.]
MLRKILLYLIAFLPTCITVSAQKKLGLEPDNWAALLSSAKLNEVNSLKSLTEQLIEADSLRALQFLDSLQASDKASGYNFRLFFCMVKADFLYYRFASYDKYKDRGLKELQPIKEQMMKLYTDAIDAAYRSENDRSIGWACFYSARRMRTFGETGWAVMYSKNGVDLLEKANYKVEPHVYIELAELLYEVTEYEESIFYARKGMASWETEDYKDAYKDPYYKYKIRALNIIGVAFYQKNLYDSAIAYYQQALQLANENKDSLWRGKLLGNIGKIMFTQNKFDSACSLFITNYQNSRHDSIYDDAANASQWAARATLAKGNKVVALAEAREAMRLLGLWPSRPYLRDTYYTLTQIFRALGNYDSAFFYNDHYTPLNDSLEKEAATSSLAISKVKLNVETNRFNIEKLNKEKQTQIVLRNFIVAGIALISLLILLILNRNRLKTKMKMERIEKEKTFMEQEVASAQTQLKMFTENIIEKTNLIEQLEEELKDRETSAGQQAIIAELSQRTILTEDDWLTFKTLFETTHPGFFAKLKEQAKDITVAEQRMAALTCLQLTTKQMAAMLGISSNSIIKAKQRLRQRFDLPTGYQMEEFISKL